MVTPRRRSSRLRGVKAQSPPAARAFTLEKLSSLIERDETPATNEQSLDAVVNSPPPATTSRTIPGAFEEDSLLTTPHAPERRPAPEHAEMHPSKVHPSTTKAPDSGLRLGFADIHEQGQHGTQHGGTNATPTKSTASAGAARRPPSSAAFDFQWPSGGQDGELSNEAQRIMDSVREEAARIKTAMQVERDEQDRRDAEADRLGHGAGRRFAKPKGRFSDVHRQAFKKMDSIANHASAWKSKYTEKNLAPGQTGVKRSPSKANLGEGGRGEATSERVDNPSPGKRAKALAGDDVSKARVTADEKPKEQALTRPTGLPSVVTTPTKSSLARATSVVKSPSKTSMIPSLVQSKSVKDLRSPPPKLGSEAAFGPAVSPLRKAASMKSILVRPNVKYSDDPLKIAAGTHLPFPAASPAPSASVQAAPASPSKLPTAVGMTPKRVNFSASTTDPDRMDVDEEDAPAQVASSAAPPPPAPSKIPSLPAQMLPAPPTNSAPAKTPEKADKMITYPSLPDHPPTPMPNPLGANPPTPPAHGRLPAPASPPKRATFDFTAPATALQRPPLQFAPTAPSTAAAPTPPTASSLMPPPPVPSRLRPPTIRHVRPSGVPTPFGAAAAAAGAGAGAAALPSIPHGLLNKKRRRAADDDASRETEAAAEKVSETGVEAKENVAPAAAGAEREGSPAKRARLMAEAKPAEPAAKGPERRRLFGGNKSGAKGERKGLSLARLNVLARPKDRR